MALSSTRIEAEAEKQRLSVDVGLPIDVFAIAAKNNLSVSIQPLEPEVSGMLVVKGDSGAVGINEDHPLARQRFTLAHEIGHLILHRRNGPIFVDASPVFYRKDNPSVSPSEHGREREANRFAAALLMPAPMIYERIRARAVDPFDEAAVKKLASEFGVSVSAMTFRLITLGVID